MKSGLKAILLGSAACMLFSFGAQAEGWYVGADAGIAFPSDTNAKNKAAGTKSKIKFRDGFAGDVVVGYKFDNNFRTDVNFGYINSQIKKLAGAVEKADLNSYALMANIYYDFANSSKFTPFIGVGAGAAYIDVDRDDNLINSKSSTEFAAQGTAGISYELTENWSMALSYRYFASFDHELNVNGSKTKYDFQTQTIMLGVRYDFVAPKTKKYAKKAPVIADLPEYMVFFALNSAEITPEAMDTLQKVADEFKRTGEVKLKAVGHTDLTGTAAYNMELSKQRAASAKAALVKLGIPAGEIATLGVGEADPLIPTADGVPELQNRRVVLEILK